MGNYQTKLSRLIEEGRISPDKLRGGVWHIDVAHDTWCAVYRYGVCDCNPDIYLRKDGEAARKDRLTAGVNRCRRRKPKGTISVRWIRPGHDC
jgi:hypothetical protein